MARTTGSPGRQTRSGQLPLVLLGLLVAAFVAAGLTALSGARPLEALGLPDPGALTTYGLPVVRAVSEISAVLTVGALLLAGFLVAPEPNGYVSVPGYRALRAASYSAGAWTVAALLMVPLTVADSLGRPVTDVLAFGRLAAIVPQLEVATAWTLTAVFAVVVFAGCRVALSWGSAVVLLAIAVVGLLPVAATGHSAAGGAHDLATDSLMLHVVAAALWVGGLVAVLALAGRRAEAAEHLPTAITRFSSLALVCWLVMAVSGVVNALVRIPLGDVFGTYYGALLLAKTGALLVLGGFGYVQRRHVVSATASGRRGALLRLGAVEVLVMLGTIGLAVALSRSAPPARGAVTPSRTEVVIGYDLSGPPTGWRLLLDWRFDLLFGTAAVVAAVAYLLGVRRLVRRGDTWPAGRTVGWLAGCAVMLLATSSGIGRYAPAMFSVHMAEHMMLSMLAPILLVLGAPVTLALRALRSGGADGPPGPREWLLSALHSRLAGVLTHPLLVLPLFVGTYYALYFSGLFAAALPSHPAHLLMLAHFLITGFLFFWPVVGVDPSPRRMAPVARLALVFASVPFHAFFGVALMSSHEVIGKEYYAGLALPWVPDLLADQRLGGGLAWASGEVPLLLVVIALVVQWSRIDERSARRADRRAELDGDAELAAYNAMLRRMADAPEPSGGADRGADAGGDGRSGLPSGRHARGEP
ncbi:MAG: bifunctional copper resistance protein CopD/cytochrome c oxidase assembly protein [Pseudonocardia sp.]|nr:bifunctional copper resistance protein CopD/cytochrome c oxidase assembly protein [Pseudonocardia sp.]